MGVHETRASSHPCRRLREKKKGAFLFSVEQVCWSGVGGELYPSFVLDLPDRAVLRLWDEPLSMRSVEVAKEKVECPLFLSPSLCHGRQQPAARQTACDRTCYPHPGK